MSVRASSTRPMCVCETLQGTGGMVALTPLASRAPCVRPAQNARESSSCPFRSRITGFRRTQMAHTFYHGRQAAICRPNLHRRWCASSALHTAAIGIAKTYARRRRVEPLKMLGTRALFLLELTALTVRGSIDAVVEARRNRLRRLQHATANLSRRAILASKGAAGCVLDAPCEVM
jgi:hypothetical protein